MYANCSTHFESRVPRPLTIAYPSNTPNKAVKKAVAAIGISASGIDFSSLDKQPVFTIILLISPVDGDQHLQAMEAIFEHLQNDNFRKFLKQSETVDHIKELLVEADQNPSWESDRNIFNGKAG